MKYDHYVALDWAKSNMAVARTTNKSSKIMVFEGPAEVEDLKTYLTSLRGTKILVIEETTTTQWLFTELTGYADKILICDPYRNRLLSEGAKSDKIDASKLVQLLKANLLKEVYHSGSAFVYLRRLMSGYEDLVKAGVRLKNQRHALIQACGKNSHEVGVELDRSAEQFVLKNVERRIENYEADKRGYEEEFKRLAKKHKEIQLQRSLPGIDYVGAIKIVSRVVAPHRFSNKGRYLSYCGLVKLDKASGGRSYGKRSPRYSRELKSVYKTAAFTAIGGNNPLNDYYKHLINEKRYSEERAEHAVARRIAVLSLGVFKSRKRYRFNEGRDTRTRID